MYQIRSVSKSSNQFLGPAKNQTKQREMANPSTRNSSTSLIRLDQTKSRVIQPNSFKCPSKDRRVQVRTKSNVITTIFEGILLISTHRPYSNTTQKTNAIRISRRQSHENRSRLPPDIKYNMEVWVQRTVRCGWEVVNGMNVVKAGPTTKNTAHERRKTEETEKTEKRAMWRAAMATLVFVVGLD